MRRRPQVLRFLAILGGEWSQMMRSSRLGLIVLLAITVLLGANCGYINKVLARKNLVDGSKAYKDRKFQDAEQLFRAAVARDPKGDTIEGKTAQLFLARTLHSLYIGNRSLTFTESDFMGEQGLGLTKKLWDKKDPVSQFVYGQLSPNTQQQYESYVALNPSSTDLDGIKKKADILKSHLNGLAGDLNKLINSGQSIYDQTRFAQVKLSDFTSQFMAQNPTGDKITRLNRLLLEDAYPTELVKKPKAEDAITEYQKALTMNPNDQSSYKAIASLYENLGRSDDWLKWVTDRANNKNIPPEQQAEALTSLSAKQNSCANEISDTEATKKKTTKDGKPAYQYVKPANAADLDKMRGCIEKGTSLIDQAMALEPDAVKTAGSLNIKSLSDTDLQKNLDLLKVFESARSYKTSLTYEASHLAEMDGKNADRDRLKQEGDAAKAKFLELSDIVKKIQKEIADRAAAKEEAITGQKANNANANKK